MKNLCAAMAKAFPEIEGAIKDSNNPAFKRDGKVLKYADLGSVVDAIKPALVKNELFFAQLTHEQQGGVCVETVVCHSSGEQMSFGKLFVPAGKNDAHGYGSALTYARRYSLMAAFGVCPEDDDGNAATASILTITPEQEIMLQDKGNEVKQDWPKFLNWAGIKALKDLPTDKFAEAMALLNKKAAPKSNPQASEELADEIPY